MNRRFRFIDLIKILFLLFMMVFFGCVEKHPTQIIPNQQPKTFFWLNPDSGLATNISKQKLHWWGEDPDGYVKGYLFALMPDLNTIPNPDTLRYIFTTKTDSLISFPLRRAQQTFLVAIRAVDNSLEQNLPEGAIIKLSPVVFWDKNQNNLFDVNDVEIKTLWSAMDQSGAKQCFPIKNSPPTIDYVPDLADGTVYAEPPQVTFPVASFSWIGHDVDGDETITSYRISLNDSMFYSFATVSSNITTVTLSAPVNSLSQAVSLVDVDVYAGTAPNLRKVGKLQNLRLEDTNFVYVQAFDVAGDKSPLLRFPSKGRTWYVRKPKGKVLIVADYIGGGDSASVRRFYMDSVFAKIQLLQVEGYEYINIRTGITSSRSLGEMVPALQHINPAFINTLKLFKCVLWYTDGTPSLAVARPSLYDYTTSPDGGCLIFTTKFVDPTSNGDPANAFRDFLPIDTLSTIPLQDNSGNVVTRFSGLIVSDSLSDNLLYPSLAFKVRIATGFCVYPIVKNPTAKYVYYLPESSTPQAYRKTPVAVIDENKRVIFITLPLERMSAIYPEGGGVIKFFEKAFKDFGLN